MKTELRYSWPSAEGVNPEYIVNFLNACEKSRFRDPWDHDRETWKRDI